MVYEEDIHGEEHNTHFWDKSKKSTILYLETCLVDQKGRVEGRKLNEEDHRSIETLEEQDLLKFERLPMEKIEELEKRCMNKKYTHKVRFSEKAWRLAHKFRKEKSERMIEN